MRSFKHSMIVIIVLALTGLLQAQDPGVSGAGDIDNILPLRTRANIHNDILERWLELILPELMRLDGIKLWIVLKHENNEDPV